MEAWNKHNIRYSRPTSTRSFTDNIDMLEKFLNVNDIWFFNINDSRKA
ncbi:MAG: hypothetical protein IJF29_01725 [Firmicutes bacterium]|nr:hypothetical protein [Bacillota bacterium]